MAVLTSKKRKTLSPFKSGLPSEMTYPIKDRTPTGNVKVRAGQQFRLGHLNMSEKDMVNAMRNKVLSSNKK